MELFIDTRERHIIPYFEAKLDGYKTCVKELSAGDYVVTYRGFILMVIERKTWDDLSNTLKDAQRRQNYKKMVDVRNVTGAVLYYAIEGDTAPPRNKQFAGIEHYKLEAYLDHLAMEHSIFTIYAPTKERFVDRIHALMNSYATRTSKILDMIDAQVQANAQSQIADADSKSPDSANSAIPVIGGHDMAIVTDRREKSSSVTFEAMYKIIGASANICAVCIKAGFTIEKLLRGEVNASQIANLHYPSGRCVGSSKAVKILSECKNPGNHVKILSQIPNLSDTSAHVILTAFSMNDLLSGKVFKLQVAELKHITSGKKLGDKVANNLFEYLQILQPTI